MNFNVYATSENGFDNTTKRYYVTLLLLYGKKEYNVIVQCDDYDVQKTDAKNLTIEFLDENYNSNIKMPFHEELFDEIELLALGMFEDLKKEEKDFTGVAEG